MKARLAYAPSPSRCPVWPPGPRVLCNGGLPEFRPSAFQAGHSPRSRQTSQRRGCLQGAHGRQWLPPLSSGLSSICASLRVPHPCPNAVHRQSTGRARRSSLGYEPYDSRLCHLGRSLVAALTSAYGRRVCSPMPLGGLPRLKPSQRVSCTNPCTNLIPDLRVSGHLMCSACLGPMVEG
jgi:hypothetical protein